MEVTPQRVAIAVGTVLLVAFGYLAFSSASGAGTAASVRLRPAMPRVGGALGNNSDLLRRLKRLEDREDAAEAELRQMRGEMARLTAAASIDCSEAPDCDALNRAPCGGGSAQNNTCGVCLKGFMEPPPAVPGNPAGAAAPTTSADADGAACVLDCSSAPNCTAVHREPCGPGSDEANTCGACAPGFQETDDEECEPEGMDCQKLKEYIWNPDPAVFKDGHPFFKEYLQCMIDKYKANAADPEVKWVRWLQDGSGWGNQMRGYLWVLDLALMTDRLPVIENQRVLKYFDVNPMLKTYAPPAGLKEVPVNLDPFQDCVKSDKLPGCILEDYHPGGNWIYQQGADNDMYLGLTRKYEMPIARMYGTKSRYNRTKMIMDFWLSHPRQFYVDQSTDLIRRLQLPMDTNLAPEQRAGQTRLVAWQYRTFIDTSYENHQRQMQELPNFLTCMKNHLTKEFTTGNLVKGKTKFFVTADDPGARTELIKAIKEVDADDAVVFNDVPMEHSAGDQPGNNNVLSALLDWWILGEADVLMHTRTTYGTYAFFRTAEKRPWSRNYPKYVIMPCPETALPDLKEVPPKDTTHT